VLIISSTTPQLTVKSCLPSFPTITARFQLGQISNVYRATKINNYPYIGVIDFLVDVGGRRADGGQLRPQLRRVVLSGVLLLADGLAVGPTAKRHQLLRSAPATITNQGRERAN
jgi:hypothetical protein